MEEDSDLRPDLFDFCIFGETIKKFWEQSLLQPLFLNLVLELKLEKQFCKGLLMTPILLTQLEK